ncbi:MAG: hypothetical protein GC178_00710 [Flavobacteriales bacterium]|nr:hypothetical protein [Flavobacteriales bacterium]
MQADTFSPSIIIKKNKPRKSEGYDTYWRFAAERLEIFYRRFHELEPPWTEDPILRVYKFTNVYRATDRVSQYLIRNVIGQGSNEPGELLFRILLFKIFNKIETWEFLRSHLKEISYETYDFNTYASLLDKAKYVNGSIYSAAYIMASGKSAFGFKMKHQNHLKLIELVVDDRFSSKLLTSKGMEEQYNSLLSLPSIGKFLAYQYAIDINYSSVSNFSEMEFVKAGPGAIDGIRKCFTDLGDYNEEDIIKLMADNQLAEFDRLDLKFDGLWGRPLQLIDCQNLFCEVDKYLRVSNPDLIGSSGRTRIKQKYRPSSLKKIQFEFPPSWEIVPE